MIASLQTILHGATGNNPSVTINIAEPFESSMPPTLAMLQAHRDRNGPAWDLSPDSNRRLLRAALLQ